MLNFNCSGINICIFIKTFLSLLEFWFCKTININIMEFCLKKEDVRRAVLKFETMLSDNYSDKALTQTLSKEQLLVVTLYGFQKFREMGFGFESEEAVSHDIFTFQNFIIDKYPLDTMTKLMSKEQLLDVALYYFNKNQEVQLDSVVLINHEEVLI